MVNTYVLGFLLAFATSLVATPLVRKLAFKINAVDLPSKRKVHLKPLPRIGGIAITLGFVLPMLLNFDLDRRLLGLLGGILVMFVIGLIDDLKGLNPWTKLVWQFIAAGVVLAGGIGIIYLSNPLNGGLIVLDNWRIPMEILGFEFNLIPLANFVSILWIVGMINTVNFLDGLDGLATGVSSIAATVLFIIALSPATANPGVALLSIILLGALLGFLPYNFFPSTVIMGDSGAYVIGLLLAVLSIYSGSKIAVGALVLGFAVIDAVWAVVRRLRRKQSPFKADREHIHHRLLDSGMSHRQVVGFFYVMAVLIAVTVLLAGGVAGFVLLILLLVATVSILRIRSAQKYL